MKKFTMRLLSVLVTVAMLLGALPMLPAGVVTAQTNDKLEDADQSPNVYLADNGSYYVDGIFAGQALGSPVTDSLGFDPNDEVSVILRTQGDSLLERAQAAGMQVGEYALTQEGQAYVAELQAAQNAVIKSLGDKVISVGYSYTTLFSGFSCVMRYSDLEDAEEMASVSKVMIAERYLTADVATNNALNAYETGIYNSSETGLTGQGMVVAVLDTGCDYTHSAFQTTPEGKLTLTSEQVEALFPVLAASKLDESAKAMDVQYSDKLPYLFDYADSDPDTYPVNDHGTHVAGIIAGNDDVITGVAVDAQLVIMKVFGNEDQGAEQEDLLAALSDAVLLGVDVINMSLGSTCGFSRASDEDATNEIYDSIREAGINLIVAASNAYSSAKGSENGDTNLTSNPDAGTLGSPASYQASMSVASVTGAKTNYLLANGTQPIYLNKAKDAAGDDIEFYDTMLDGRESVELEYVLVPGIGNDGNYANVDVKGKIAVVKRGVTTFEDKVTTAENYGAIGVIIYNNVSGTISMTVGLAKLPACSISMDAGVYFEENPTGTIVLHAENLAGPFMSDFSSWGPNPDLILTPDVTSYGGDIYSAVRGGYDIYSGTSMAAPNLAGSATLVREYLKKTYPELTYDELVPYVDRLLMSTASILRNEEGNPYSPRKQGAGLADAARAIGTGAYLLVEGSDKSKISLGHDPEKTGEYILTFHLVNQNDTTRSYDLDVIAMTETVSSDNKTVAEKAYILSPSLEYTVENGTLVGSKVTVGGYGDATITVKMTLSQEDRDYLDANFKNGMYVEGFVTLDSEADNIDLTLPYLGFYGDWTQAPMLDVTAFEVGAEQDDPSILEEDKLKADVYASIPMIAFYSGSELTYYYMGQVGYTLADGYEIPPVLEEHCSLTTSQKGNFKIYYIAAGLLRNAKTTTMTITNAVTGDVVFERETENSRKSYYSGAQVGGHVLVEFDASEANLANNTEYTFTMTCALDWEGEQNNSNNTFSFTFWLDDESPVLKKEETTVRVNTDSNGYITQYLLDMYVYDNHYVQGYMLYTYDSLDASGNPIGLEQVITGMIPVEDFEQGKVNKLTHDLTSVWHKLKDGSEAGTKNLGVQVVDFAKHATAAYFTLSQKTAESVAFENGRLSTAKGDEVSFTLAPNRQFNLLKYLETTPTNVWAEDLDWVSSDPSVAIVKGGMVTAVSEGNATITATTRDTENPCSASVTIRCTGEGESTIKLQALTLNMSSVTLERGESVDLWVDVSPYNVTDFPELVWNSASTYVKLEVDPNDPTHCTVFAAESGSATVTVKATGTLFSASCRVSIKEEFEIEGSYLRTYTGRGDENGVVEIPAEKGITIIYAYAFLGNEHITKVIIPEGVEEIQYAAFYGCTNLKEVVLPSTCKVVGEWAFGHDTSLEFINLGSVETIFQLAFYNNNKLKSVDLSSCNVICDHAFAFCSSIEKVDISHVSMLGMYAFVYCTGLSTLITSEQNRISDYCFALCTSLEELNLKATYVGEMAFYDCIYLTDLVFLSNVTELDYGAFYFCSSLVNLTFNGTVKIIDDYAFANCAALSSIYIPAGCEYLGQYAFGACTAAASITFSAKANIQSIGMGPFYGVSKVTAFALEPGSNTLTVNDGILYNKSMTRVVLVPYAKTINEYRVPNSVTEIGEYAFAMVKTLTSVRLNQVVTICEGAFYDSNIKSVIFGSACREIGKDAFYDCSSLDAVTLSDQIVKIDDYAFSGCTGIRWGELILPESLTYLGEFAFERNLKLESVTVPAGITEINARVFNNCRKLTTVRLLGEVTSVGDYAFACCYALTDIDLPDSITTLGEACFGETTALVEIKLPSSLTAIPAYCFFNSAMLESVDVPASVESVGEFAFDGAEKLATFDFSHIKTIEGYAFRDTALTELTSPTLEYIGEAAFYGGDLLSVDLPAVVEIADYGLFYNVSLTDVKLDNLEIVGEYGLARLLALTSLSLPT